MGCHVFSYLSLLLSITILNDNISREEDSQMAYSYKHQTHCVKYRISTSGAVMHR